jgi:hypothetical protein
MLKGIGGWEEEIIVGLWGLRIVLGIREILKGGFYY